MRPRGAANTRRNSSIPASYQAVGIREGSANMDLTVGSFDDPSDFVPKTHFSAENQVQKWKHYINWVMKR